MRTTLTLAQKNFVLNIYFLQTDFMWCRWTTLNPTSSPVRKPKAITLRPRFQPHPFWTHQTRRSMLVNSSAPSATSPLHDPTKRSTLYTNDRTSLSQIPFILPTLPIYYHIHLPVSFYYWFWLGPFVFVDPNFFIDNI